MPILGSVFTARVRSTREGTVFTGVCLFTSGGGGVPTFLVVGGTFSQVWTGGGGTYSGLGGGGTYSHAGWGGTNSQVWMGGTYLPRSGVGGYLPMVGTPPPTWEGRYPCPVPKSLSCHPKLFALQNDTI